MGKFTLHNKHTKLVHVIADTLYFIDYVRMLLI
jgi:hypothetical protein